MHARGRRERSWIEGDSRRYFAPHRVLLHRRAIGIHVRSYEGQPARARTTTRPGGPRVGWLAPQRSQWCSERLERSEASGHRCPPEQARALGRDVPTVSLAEHRLCRLCDLTVGQLFEPPRPRLVVDREGPRWPPASVADSLVLKLAAAKAPCVARRCLPPASAIGARELDDAVAVSRRSRDGAEAHAPTASVTSRGVVHRDAGLAGDLDAAPTVRDALASMRRGLDREPAVPAEMGDAFEKLRHWWKVRPGRPSTAPPALLGAPLEVETRAAVRPRAASSRSRAASSVSQRARRSIAQAKRACARSPHALSAHAKRAAREPPACR